MAVLANFEIIIPDSSVPSQACPSTGSGRWFDKLTMSGIYIGGSIALITGWNIRRYWLGVVPSEFLIKLTELNTPPFLKIII